MLIMPRCALKPRVPFFVNTQNWHTHQKVPRLCRLDPEWEKQPQSQLNINLCAYSCETNLQLVPHLLNPIQGRNQVENDIFTSNIPEKQVHFVFSAHARLMFRDTVTLEDAITVVSVMESSMQVSIFCVSYVYPYYQVT